MPLKLLHIFLESVGRFKLFFSVAMKLNVILLKSSTKAYNYIWEETLPNQEILVSFLLPLHVISGLLEAAIYFFF